MVGQAGGGGDVPSLRTAYGTWTLTEVIAAQPGYGGGYPCNVLLNGKQVSPGAPINTGIPAFQRLQVAFGGNLYGMTFDEIWNGWQNYSWYQNDSLGLSAGPAATPTPPGLPTYNPPYTPSAENTSISGGAGSLQTADGVWTLGAVSGSGRIVQLNGIPVWITGFSTPYIADQMTVWASGQLFFHRADFAPGWVYWAGNQANTVTAPTAGPVPVNVAVSPAHPSVSGASAGTHVADVIVTMSNGSGFSGSLTALTTFNPASGYFSISGGAIITGPTVPIPFDPYFVMVTASQNGGDYKAIINVNVT
jgi:hypothetical protein